jgi:hypothetical protein
MRVAADIGPIPITAPDVFSLQFEPSASKARRARQQWLMSELAMAAGRN